MQHDDLKSTNVDFHLDVSETKDGGAILLASWQARFEKTSFKIEIEAVTDNQVREAISLMSDLQKRMLDDLKSWNEVHGPAKASQK